MVRTLGQSMLALRLGALDAWTTSGPTFTNVGTGIDSMAVGQQHYVTLGLDGSLTYYSLGRFAASNLGQTQTPAYVQSTSFRLLVPQRRLITDIGQFILTWQICKKLRQRDLLKCVDAQNL